VTDASPADNGTESATRTRRLMGVAHIAGFFGVSPVTVNRWIWGAEHNELPPTPAADVEIPTANSDVMIRGWELCREKEWREWKANLPGRGWRKGVTGERRYTTYEHIGKRAGRTHKSESS
jgi:hypothetical protein